MCSGSHCRDAADICQDVGLDEAIAGATANEALSNLQRVLADLHEVPDLDEELRRRVDAVRTDIASILGA